ncbi:hypothetical protein M3629_22890 [Paenibacillus polysaccharolyticus]|nr:hypothetical protein [Paenibacillus polysaccharolyticus]
MATTNWWADVSVNADTDTVLDAKPGAGVDVSESVNVNASVRTGGKHFLE